MKNKLYLLAITLLFSSFSIAQVRTGEKTITVNKVTGDTTITESVVILRLRILLLVTI